MGNRAYGLTNQGFYGNMAYQNTSVLILVNVRKTLGGFMSQNWRNKLPHNAHGKGQVRMHIEVVFENGVRSSVGTLASPIYDNRNVIQARVEDLTNWVNKHEPNVVESEGFTTDQTQWGSSVVRRGELALAFLKVLKLEEGIELHPQKLRSSIGNEVKKLNDLFPGLNVTDAEAKDLVREIGEFLLEETVKPNREERRQSTDRHDVGG